MSRSEMEFLVAPTYLSAVSLEFLRTINTQCLRANELGDCLPWQNNGKSEVIRNWEFSLAIQAHSRLARIHCDDDTSHTLAAWTNCGNAWTLFAAAVSGVNENGWNFNGLCVWTSFHSQFSVSLHNSRLCYRRTEHLAPHWTAHNGFKETCVLDRRSSLEPVTSKMTDLFPQPGNRAKIFWKSFFCSFLCRSSCVKISICVILWILFSKKIFWSVFIDWPSQLRYFLNRFQAYWSFTLRIPGSKVSYLSRCQVKLLATIWFG